MASNADAATSGYTAPYPPLNHYTSIGLGFRSLTPKVSLSDIHVSIGPNLLTHKVVPAHSLYLFFGLLSYLSQVLYPYSGTPESGSGNGISSYQARKSLFLKKKRTKRLRASAQSLNEFEFFRAVACFDRADSVHGLERVY